MFKRPVIGPLRIVGKTASRKFPHFQVITYTFTADPLTGTRFIAAIT
ncbi:MAG: hypothetical protein JRE29_05400 [Deltaproteobacteria bacterium]|nr:hypothetical protein [Deltaproteobacteria bacterium]